MSDKPLTASQRRGLEILRDHPNLGYPKEFAHLMWPDSPGWNTRRKCGNYGVHKGGGMYVTAGCYLGRLERLGLVESRYLYRDSNERRWTLTQKAVGLLA